MEPYDIGNRIKKAALTCITSYRRTGRTTRMLDSLKDGDRVIFSNRKEAKRIEHMAMQRGLVIECLVVEPRDSDRLRGLDERPTKFDHQWLEDMYLMALDEASSEINLWYYKLNPRMPKDHE